MPEVVNGAPELYPIVLKLAGRECLVVGGGPIALRKTAELLRCGAHVRAVAPAWCAGFASMDGQASFTRTSRAFDPSDLVGIHLAVAATDDRGTQELIASEAGKRGILLNVVDVPTLCGFFVPASVRRGSLVVSVSTEGKSPGFAAAVRDRIAEALAEEIGPALERLDEARRLTRARFPEEQDRRREALGRLLTPAAVDGLMEGRLETFEAHWRSWRESL